VLGRSFSFQLLTAVSQIDIDELFSVIEKAQRMGIIVPSGEGPERPFTFRHELVRQTLLVGISVPRQEQLHASVAEAIERLNPNAAEESAGEIADHLLKAGSFADRDAVVGWLIRAGNAALEAVAFEEARVNFESALSRVDKNDKRRRAELLYNLGMAHRGLGRWGDAHRNWEEALGIFTAVDDRESIARTCFRLAQGAYWARGWREAMEIAEHGLARLSGVNSDKVDVSMPLDCQKEAFALVRGLIQRDYPFTDKEEAHRFFTQLTGLFRNLNYTARNATQYTSYLAQIEKLVKNLGHTSAATPEAHGAPHVPTSSSSPGRSTERPRAQG
jgi:tetratricopeptide (TPR) repeat protein